MSDRRFENHPALRAARVGPSRGGAQGSESASPIRDLTVAAPLKRRRRPHAYPQTRATHRFPAIRDLTVAAPLKPVMVQPSPRITGTFLSAT